MQYSFRHKANKKNKGQHDHKDLYGSSQAVDITGGKSYNDARVVQFAREIKQLKEKIELQTEYTRKLEQEKTELTAKLESYKRRCSDLQKNLDDKDQHLNEVLSSVTAEHSKPIAVNRHKEKKGWFGFGSPRSSKRTPGHGLSSTPQPNMGLFSTPQPRPNPLSSMNTSPYQTVNTNGGINGGSGSSQSSTDVFNGVHQSPSIEIRDDYIGNSPASPLNDIYATQPMTGSLPRTRPRTQRTASVHIMGGDITGDGDTPQWGQIGIGTASLVGMDKGEMEYKIKNTGSKDKLRNYIRDLFDQYYFMEKEKSKYFQELVKARHNAGWAEKEKMGADKDAAKAKEKERNAHNHIKSLQKSLDKERKKVEKYKQGFEDFKQVQLKKRKELLMSERKLQDIISMKDEFIQRACYKLILYKERLSNFEVPVFTEYVILLAPDIHVLMRYDGEGVNGPGFNGGNLNQLHEDMVHKQTPGGPGFSNDDINSAGGTVTSIASARSDSKSIGRRKSSSRKSSVSRDGDAAPGLPEDNQVGDVNAEPSIDNKHKKKKDKKKKKKKRVKSHESALDDAKERELKEDQDPDQININIKATSKTKKKKKSRRLSMNDKPNSGPASLSNLSKKIEKEKLKKKKLKEAEKKKKSEEKRQKMKEVMEDDEDMMGMGLEDMVSSDSSSSSEEEEFMLWKTDESDDKELAKVHEYRLDTKGKYVEDTRDGVTNNLSNYVELKIVKYPGTGELFMVITKFDDKKDASEVFRTDFVRCLNIEKNQIEEDFTIYFENLTMIFRADDYQRANAILINLRALFEQHCANIQPELPPPPSTTVTDQMGLFLGGL